MIQVSRTFKNLKKFLSNLHKFCFPLFFFTEYNILTNVRNLFRVVTIRWQICNVKSPINPPQGVQPSTVGFFAIALFLGSTQYKLFFVGATSKGGVESLFDYISHFLMKFEAFPCTAERLWFYSYQSFPLAVANSTLVDSTLLKIYYTCLLLVSECIANTEITWRSFFVSNRISCF